MPRKVRVEIARWLPTLWFWLWVVVLVMGCGRGPTEPRPCDFYVEPGQVVTVRPGYVYCVVVKF